MKILGPIFLLVVVWLVFGPSRPSDPPKPELTAEQKEKKAAEDREWATNVLAVRAIKSAMKNPDSFKLEEAVRMDDGTLCLSYRATNSFNAIVPGQAVITKTAGATSDDQTGKFRKLWNSACAGKTGANIRHIRLAI